MRVVTKAGVRRRLSRIKAVAQPRTRLRRLLGMPPGIREGAGGAPASFGAWIERSSGRSSATYPYGWQTPDLKIDKPARVAAAVHVYFPELLPEILAHLAQIPVRFDLLVTNASGVPLRIDRSGLPRLGQVRLLEVPNHGRDILPLVCLVNAGLLDPYDLVVKVHTKKSEWRAEHELGGTGDSWRSDLLGSLLGSEAAVSAILDAFAARPDLGILTSPGSVLGPEMWGDNQPITEALLRRLELPLVEKDLRFAAGSMYWVRGFVLQGLRSLNLSDSDFEPEAGQVNATTAHAVERIIGILAGEAGLQIVETDRAHGEPGGWQRFGSDAVPSPRARIVPFYLPQFHTITENDLWWGPGFTEWTNVSAGRPVYRGHHQPKIPRDLGFYDLTMESTRERQAELAKGHGIAGFMYYYYWFAGRRLLERPIEALLAGDLDFPFCIMWANENWTRRWDGRSENVLMGQDYEGHPASEFIEDILPFLRDPRYLRVDGKAVLAVYRPGQMDDFPAVVRGWRDRAAQAGVPLHVLSVDVAREFDALKGTPQDNGLDGMLTFAPHNCLWSWIGHDGLDVDPRFTGNLLSYSALVRDSERRVNSGVPDGSYPGVMVTFDNTARRQWASDVWYGSNPYTFRRWLATAVRSVAHREPEQRVVFINAWNEWAEGAVLEPSDRFGSTYLLAVRDVVHA